MFSIYCLSHISIFFLPDLLNILFPISLPCPFFGCILSNVLRFIFQFTNSLFICIYSTYTRLLFLILIIILFFIFRGSIWGFLSQFYLVFLDSVYFFFMFLFPLSIALDILNNLYLVYDNCYIMSNSLHCGFY